MHSGVGGVRLTHVRTATATALSEVKQTYAPTSALSQRPPRPPSLHNRQPMRLLAHPCKALGGLRLTMKAQASGEFAAPSCIRDSWRLEGSQNFFISLANFDLKLIPALTLFLL
jgi:hypothetical protein